MRKLLIFLTLLSTCLHVQAELPLSVAEALKNAGIPQQNVAIFVQPVLSDAPILNHNGDKSMNPASTMKLVTTNAALDTLGPTFRWETEVYRDGNIVNGVLNGDLIIKGYGDPSFGAKEFWRLLMRLQQTGIRQIKGNLVIDKSYFSSQASNRDTFDEETWRAYNAMPSAFLVNGRNTSFKFTANKNNVVIQQEFELPEIEIINKMKRAQGNCGAWRNSMGYNVKTLLNKVSVTFNGTFAAECEEKYLELSLFDDEQYAFFTFKKLWAQLGGKFNGNLKIREVSAAAEKMLTQQSDPLSHVIRDINKWSNNLMARQLLLTLGAETTNEPANETNGAMAIKNWLNSKGLRFDELVIENGSGLSRIERISATHLGQMLVKTYHSNIMPEFIASLPILSKDGTVMTRLKDSQSSGRAHLKTGSLDGVSAIAGYILDANNHRYVLIMITNYANASASKNAQDALIEWVHQQP